MIPIKLEIEGLYSYKEKQIIDFTQLTAAGLFGIFGAVGSGKSSILEGILLALYGSTERLADRGEKSSLLNLQSDSLLISFEFLGGKNNSKTFLSRYSAKRNPKNFDDIKPAEHTFYEKIDAELVPVSLKAEEILGMKKEHFKQTVIIPQGKFRDFIDQKPKEQAEMMKELFGLERFDLSAKTGSLLKNNREVKNRLEGQLLALQDISEALLNEKKSQKEKTDAELKTQKEVLSIKEKVFKKQEFLQEKHSQWLQFETEWKAIEKQRPDIESKKSQFKEFLRAKTYLKPVWEQLKEQKVEAEKFRVSIIDCSRFKVSYEEEIKEHEKELQDLKKKADQKSAREAKIRDLEKVIEIKALEEEVTHLTETANSLKPSLDAKKSLIQEILDQIKKLELELEKGTLPDSSLLAEWKSAAKTWEQDQELLLKSQTEIANLSATIEELKSQTKTLLTKLPEGVEDFDTAISGQKFQLLRAEEQIEKLNKKAGLAAHVHLLEDGQPCPLCGSIEHPNPLERDKENKSLTKIQDDLKKLRQELEQLQMDRQTHRELEIHLKNQLDQKEKLEAETKTLEDRLHQLKASLAAQEINSLSDLKEKITLAEASIKEKGQVQSQLKTLRTNLDAERIALDELQERVRGAEQEVIQVQAKFLSKREEITNPEFCKDYFAKSTPIIKSAIEKVELDIRTTADLLEGKLKVLQETRTKETTNLTNLKTYEKNLESTQSKIKVLESEFEKLKKAHGFEDQDALIALFDHSLDADKVDAEIRQFEDRSLLVQKRIEELTEIEGLKDFSREEFLKLEGELKEIKSNFEGLQKQQTLIDEEIKSIKSKLEEKQSLLKILGEKENREENLKELERLFKGSGFVKYVSSIYLKELCNTANIRFMNLTKNRLSLDIDEDNTFWVVDYLNGGKKRLLKSLSGGQTFQASLCLALALAEKVKSLNQADQSFFFLDEGFGALDKNSLRVVFETLKSLRHENRIVGIISHVEELQQEIGVYAKVELDPERGSQVEYSF